MGARFALILGGITISFVGIIFRLYDLQLNEGTYYFAQAKQQSTLSNMKSSRRGTIYFVDKDGKKFSASVNKEFPEIYVDSSQIEDKQEVASAISIIADITREEALKKLSTSNEYVSIIKKASNAQIEKAGDLGQKGIFVRNYSSRSYPLGNLFSQALGFVGPDSKQSADTGRSGLEKFYNEKLSGVSQKKSENESEAEILLGGEDLLIGIDLNVQKEAELVLAKLVANSKSDSGTVIVQDPKTGKMVAMGSLPNFDPNNYSASKMDSYMNPAVEKVYEPGSVFKVLTMSAGIDSGKITPDTTYNDTGSVKLSGYTIRNWDGKAHGKVTMTNIIEKSLNTGTVYAERLIGNTIFTDYIKKFGFGEKTGVDLPAEVRGDLRNINPKSVAVAFANAAFGQGVSVTPLQMINAISAIANGGSLMRPYFNLELGSEEIRRVMSEDTAKKVTAMMVSAVDKGKLASIEGYSIAGKTGTAQVPDLKKGGYTDRVIDTYIGFAPASDPKFTILIKIDEPEGSPLAGETVVPAFRDLAKFLLQYYSVPPDRINN